MITGTENYILRGDFVSMELLEIFALNSMIFLEAAGVGIITLGSIYSSVISVKMLFRKEKDAYLHFRRQLIRAILLGLEFLVAADIIRTVVIDLTFTSVGVLALLILIRTFLSFTLEVEITGRFPWQGEDGKPIEH
jgi:uncharacterized membrane protein